MLEEENKERPSGGSWKTYSVSVSAGSPRMINSRPQWNSKARASLPPLQPLLVTRSSKEEWPVAGSDDIGIWPYPSTPGGRPVSMTPSGNLAAPQQPSREFEFKKDKLSFFDKECSRILDHVYLGSEAVAKNREILKQKGITHVLNCVGFVCAEYFKNELVYKTLWLQDSPSEDITSVLYDVFDYFEDVREQGGRVFVHCCQGVSRSTSLVIAYLMWKEGQSFEDAFQHVKAAREVTNPNIGFACQLLLCQKRVHAEPASPSSVLRMYRMAPHSPYDPLHLVPKIVSEPGSERLDSRGAFIVHVPSAIFVWMGKLCSKVMSDNAKAAAHQVIRYERAQGPVLAINEDEEASDFWCALGLQKQTADGCGIEIRNEEAIAPSIHPSLGQRKVDEYDLDFQLFHKAISGGIVPPFPLSGSETETCIPGKENGWSRLRRKIASGIMKELITSSKLSCSSTQTNQAPDTPLSPSPSYKTSSPAAKMMNSFKEVKYTVPFIDTPPSPSPSLSSLDSFSSFIVSKTNLSSTSPSHSPSNSDSSSYFTFSPSSSNWSEISQLSAQPSPSGLDSTDPIKTRFSDSLCLPLQASSPPPEKMLLPSPALRATNVSLRGGTSTSLAERRGSSPPPWMMLPSVDEGDLYIGYDNFQQEGSSDTYKELREELMYDAADNDL